MEFTFDKQWMKMHGLVGIILTLGFYSKTWLNDAFMCFRMVLALYDGSIWK